MVYLLKWWLSMAMLNNQMVYENPRGVGHENMFFWELCFCQRTVVNLVLFNVCSGSIGSEIVSRIRDAMKYPYPIPLYWLVHRYPSMGHNDLLGGSSRLVTGDRNPGDRKSTLGEASPKKTNQFLKKPWSCKSSSHPSRIPTMPTCSLMKIP